MYSIYRLPLYSCDTGMVGMMGVAAVTKKRGGYTNTKLHGMMAWAGLILSGAGLYVIYQHKESMGKNHFTTYHSWGKSAIEPMLICVHDVSHPSSCARNLELFHSDNSWPFSSRWMHHDGLGGGRITPP